MDKFEKDFGELKKEIDEKYGIIETKSVNTSQRKTSILTKITDRLKNPYINTVYIFIFVFILLLIIRPGFLYTKDKNTEEKSLSFNKLIVFSGLLTIPYLGWSIYKKLK